jgi:hypothetical protein
MMWISPGVELPPLEDDPDREPPPERPPYSGVSIGSDLVGVRFAGNDELDLGEYRCCPPNTPTRVWPGSMRPPG